MITKLDTPCVSDPFPYTCTNSFITSDNIKVAARIYPETLYEQYKSNIEWEVPYAANKGLDSIVGTAETFEFSPSPDDPDSDVGRVGVGLAYNITAEVEINGETISATKSIVQDELDILRQEYYDMDKSVKPKRTDFVNNTIYNMWWAQLFPKLLSPEFDFYGFNIKNSYSWALIKIDQHLQNIRNTTGNHAMTINSGYRTPYRNKSVGGELDSAHIYGYATDISPIVDYNDDGDSGGDYADDDWDALCVKAVNEGACVEPRSATHTDSTTSGWLHMDWNVYGVCRVGWPSHLKITKDESAEDLCAGTHQ